VDWREEILGRRHGYTTPDVGESASLISPLDQRVNCPERYLPELTINSLLRRMSLMARVRAGLCCSARASSALVSAPQTLEALIDHVRDEFGVDS